MRARSRPTGSFVRAMEWVCGLGLALLPGTVLAAPGDLTISDGRMQVLMASRPAAGYFSLHNEGQKAVSLVGASAPDCSSVMLHHSSTKGGMASMEMVDAVPVPPGQTLHFAPGAYHLMCMDPSGALLARKGVEQVTLRFADGQSLVAPFAIGGPRE